MSTQHNNNNDAALPVIESNRLSEETEKTVCPAVQKTDPFDLSTDLECFSAPPELVQIFEQKVKIERTKAELKFTKMVSKLKMEHNKIIAELEIALRAAIAERDVARGEREMARHERNVAIAERDIMVIERNFLKKGNN